MKRLPHLFSFCLAGLILAPDASHAQFITVPIVTQVQGVTFYRTSITLANGSSSLSSNVELVFIYRSPTDGALRQAIASLGSPIGPRRSLFFEDIVQFFKNAGVIRSQDLSAALFGTLIVLFSDVSATDASVVARTYSPAAGGGTNGIAYVGRDFVTVGTNERLSAIVRNGSFGTDGSTRANVGFVNESDVTTDIEILYYDGDSGALLKQFNLSAVTGRMLASGEVTQLNNVFSDPAIPAATRSMIVEARVTEDSALASGYAVQLDNTTNDGAFFLMVEEPSD
jgi:hypothetical protein